MRGIKDQLTGAGGCASNQFSLNKSRQCSIQQRWKESTRPRNYWPGDQSTRNHQRYIEPGTDECAVRIIIVNNSKTRQQPWRRHFLIESIALNQWPSDRDEAGNERPCFLKRRSDSIDSNLPLCNSG